MPRPAKSTKPRSARAKNPPASDLTREEFLVRRIAEIEADQRAIRARVNPSWIALLQLGRDLDSCHEELVQFRASQGDQTTLDPAALVQGIEAAIRDEAEGLPEDDVERLYVAACERLGLVPDGGPGGAP